MTSRREAKDTADKVAAAFEEASNAFNAAKRTNAEQVTVSRGTLYYLIVLASASAGLEVQDATKLT